MYGVFLLKEHPADAVAEFQKEIEITPKDVDARAQIAFADLTKGDYARGRRYASEAVKLAPGNFAAHLVSGQLWLALGKIEQALEETQTAVKLAPDSADAHLALSRCYAQANRPQDAGRERREFQRLRTLQERAGQ
jgi:Tfp pilus assembly protein PilF